MIFLFALGFVGTAAAAPAEKVEPDARCSVCGMFVAKYDNWVSQVRLADGTVLFFDGVKDMLVFYFNPRAYGSTEKKDISEIWVKDYYSLAWLDGRQSFFVIGSDVYGPMGKEFIPFATRDAAENFRKDHKGEQILNLDDITDDMVQAMRSGMKMRHGEK